MTLNEAALRKLDREESFKLTLEYQNLSVLREYYEKLESDIIATKLVNSKLCNQMKLLERQSWLNEQYYRKECLEMFGVQESIIDKALEGKALNLFEKNDIVIHPGNIEVCHWVKHNVEPRKGYQ